VTLSARVSSRLTLAIRATTLSAMAASATKRLAVKVIRRLHGHGHQALLAGGCVRDMLMGRRPADYDVATSATPDEVKALFRRVLMVGAKFGVAIVLEGRRQVEVATFRSDVSYTDGRRPDSVRFADARADAMRRDFTVNGMFQDPLTDEVIDYVGGRKDLAARRIRAIGDPDERFGEDYLRMLRAVRFACRLEFDLEEATAEAIRRRAGRITAISGERIHDEVFKMLAQPSAARAAEMMHELGLLEAILPELYAESGLWPAARRRIEAVAGRADAVLSAGALLCDLRAPRITEIIRRWGGSNAERGSLVWLAGHVGRWRELAEGSLAQLKEALAHPDFERLAALSRVEEKAATGSGRCWRAIRARAGRIDPGRIAPPAFVTGEDLIGMGLPPGPAMGRILKRIYEEQLNEALATRAEALRMAQDLIAKTRTDPGG